MAFCRGNEADGAMTMLVVVPGEELLAVQAGSLDRAEAAGKVGPVLQRLELRFAVGVVVGNVWPGVGLGDAKIGQQALEIDFLAGALGRMGDASAKR